ncbi:MAG TPA: CocE/NonD family hydrolase, partial [Capillimicrobium sp.]|nr:CocE/NonD family hydrolase [Capillimicrobium sp.]
SGDPDDVVGATGTLLQHAAGTVAFDAPTLTSAATGGDLAYDGPFWKTRSPIEVVDRIDVPAFVVGGHHDLFQRGEPLIYERLKRHVPARLLMGPWTHVGGSTGEGLPRDGVPALEQIALRWFDRYLLGLPTGVAEIPKVTQYVYGRERYETQADWPDPRLRPRRLYLRGGGALAAAPPATAEAPQSFAQQPLSGLCTQSTSQWTAGLTEQMPCTTDNRLNELGEAVYTTPPLERDLELSGPVLANVWLRTTARDAAVTVRLTDVDPSGRSTELTTGWLAAGFRAVDRGRSRVVDGQLLQPWHPFTRESVLPVAPGEPVELPVEVFPVRATIAAGHRLRVTVGPSDFPHQAPTATRLLDELGGVDEVLTDPGHASYVALPALGECRLGCAPLPVPDLLRGDG